uniref:Uncharacterized protein n=1 Tax=Oryza nivara TaxID=4536 RepID=A0A0E0FJF6_ORYNI
MFWSRFAGSPSVQARVFAIVRHQAPPFCAASAVGDITRPGRLAEVTLPIGFFASPCLHVFLDPTRYISLLLLRL